MYQITFIFDIFRNDLIINITKASPFWFKILKTFNQTILSPIEYLTTEEFYYIYATTSLAHHLDMTLINKNYHLFTNINIDKLLNKMMNYVLKHTNCSTLEILLVTCGCLVGLKESISFSTNDSQILIAVLSLPWLNISNNIFKSLPIYNYINDIMKKCSSLLSKLFNKIKTK